MKERKKNRVNEISQKGKEGWKVRKKERKKSRNKRNQGREARNEGRKSKNEGTKEVSAIRRRKK